MDCNGGDPEYYCRTPDDTCADVGDECKDGRCVFSPKVNHWTCEEYPKCPVG
jgi:hypothetical protein